MGRVRSIIERLQDLAGGVGAHRPRTGPGASSISEESVSFESKASRRRKHPGDDLPMPDAVRSEEGERR